MTQIIENFLNFKKKIFLTILLDVKNNAYRLILNQILIRNLLICHEIENHKLWNFKIHIFNVLKIELLQ